MNREQYEAWLKENFPGQDISFCLRMFDMIAPRLHQEGVEFDPRG